MTPQVGYMSYLPEMRLMLNQDILTNPSRIRSRSKDLREISEAGILRWKVGPQNSKYQTGEIKYALESCQVSTWINQKKISKILNQWATKIMIVCKCRKIIMKKKMGWVQYVQSAFLISEI